MRQASVVVAVAAIVAAVSFPNTVLASWCHDNPALGQPNELPIDAGAMTHVASVINGELYTTGGGVGDGASGDRIYVAHLWGYSGYDYGYAFGLLLGPQINQTLGVAFTRLTARLARHIEQGAPWIPQAIVDMIAAKGIDFFLDWQYEESKPFMDPEVFAEMHGMADASGMSYDVIRRIHFFGEITRGACSIFGATDTATKGGSRVMLRAFDWDTSLGLQNNPTITVYHPLTGSSSSSASRRSSVVARQQYPQADKGESVTKEGTVPSSLLGHAWLNIGWAGWIGSLSGMSSRRLGMGSIGITNPDNSFGNQTYVGEPFIFLQRRILQHATSIRDVEAMIMEAHRTCHLVYGATIGRSAGAHKTEAQRAAHDNPDRGVAARAPSSHEHGADQPFVMVQYSATKVRFFNASDLQPLESWHPRIPDVVYECMDWVCPSFQRKMAERLTMFHGNIDPELTLRNITSVVMTGNLHVYTVDLDTGIAYIANARPDDVATGDPHAYGRVFTRFNVTALFLATR